MRPYSTKKYVTCPQHQILISYVFSESHIFYVLWFDTRYVI